MRWGLFCDATGIVWPEIHRFVVRNFQPPLKARRRASKHSLDALCRQDDLVLKEIGERIGLTRERVRQIEPEALAKLKEAMMAGMEA